MANAFYSLYSHVSRTPLPKLTPPEPARSPDPLEMPYRFRGGGDGARDRSEPRSPVARLKETVARMCLYTGGARRASERDSERKRHSLPEVVDIVLENAKLQASLDVRHDPHRELEEEEGEHGQQTATTDAPMQPSGLDARCHMVARGTVDQSDGLEADWNGATSSADLEKSGTGILSKTREPPSSRSRGVSLESSDAEEDRHILSYSADPRSDEYGQGEGPMSAGHPVPHSGPPPRCVVFTGWEGDNVTSLATRGPIHGSNGPEQARRLLCPLKHFSDKSNRANSFEIEEVLYIGSLLLIRDSLTATHSPFIHSFIHPSLHGVSSHVLELSLSHFCLPSGEQCRRRGLWTVGKYTNDLNDTSAQRWVDACVANSSSSSSSSSSDAEAQQSRVKALWLTDNPGGPYQLLIVRSGPTAKCLRTLCTLTSPL